MAIPYTQPYWKRPQASGDARIMHEVTLPFQARNQLLYASVVTVAQNAGQLVMRGTIPLRPHKIVERLQQIPLLER